MEETAWGVKKVNSQNCPLQEHHIQQLSLWDWKNSQHCVTLSCPSPCSVFQPFFPVVSNNSYVNASRTRIKRYSNISSLYPFSENQYQPMNSIENPQMKSFQGATIQAPFT